jgi:hypothetical protein
MRISNVKGATQTNFIEVRHYENSLINISQNLKPVKSDFTIGFWKVKMINLVPKEYSCSNFVNNYS